MPGALFLLGRGLQRVAEPLQEPPDAIGRYLVALTGKFLGQLVGRLGSPPQQRRRVAAGLWVDQQVEVLQYPGLGLGYRLLARSWGTLALLGLHARGDLGLSLYHRVAAHPRPFGNSRLVAEHLGRGPCQHPALPLVQVGQHQVEEPREPLGIDLHSLIILRAVYSAVDPNCPDERFAVVFVGVEVVLDGADQFGHGAEHTAADGFFGQLSEPPLDQIEL